MNRQEAEQLAERIRIEAPPSILVIGIEPFGPATNPFLGTDYFVKCACRIPSIPFAVKSFEHWEDLKHHVLLRLCKWVYERLSR
jgi:hypothetical protein